jgi:hypothetical protein
VILKIFSPKNFANKLAFFAQSKAKLRKNVIITLVFEKKRQFFRKKLAKIAENCDHNIDPRPMLFKKISTKKIGEQMSVFDSEQGLTMQKFDNRNCFLRKSHKNCDHKT